MRLSLFRHALCALLLVLAASAARADASWGIGGSSSSGGDGDSAPPVATPEPTLKSSSSSSTPPSTPAPAATPDAASFGAGASMEPLEARKPSQAEKWAALCLAYFAFNYLKGKKKNANHAHAIAESLRPMLESQFSHLGPGPIVVASGGDNNDNNNDNDDGGARKRSPILLRESANEFVLWASGRRNLGDPGQGSGALLRLRLRPRQDALSNVLAVAEGLPDQLEVTLPLPSSSSSSSSSSAAAATGRGGGRGGGVPVALAVGRPAALREVFEDYEDLKRLARPVPCNGAPVRGLAWWPSSTISDVGASSSSSSSSGGGGGGGLAAVADSPQALADVVASGPMGQALAASARAALASARVVATGQPKPRLRVLRLNGDGALRKGGAAGAPVLSAVFDLPPPGASDFDAAAEDVSRLVAALLGTADAVAAYGRAMSPEARSKALALRTSAAAAAAAAAGDGRSSAAAASSSSSSSSSPAAALEARRAAAREAEKQKLASMSSEAKEKYLLRKQRIEQKRLMKKRTVRA